MSFSVVLVKPDCIERGLVEDLELEIQKTGLRIVNKTKIQLTEEKIYQFQPYLRDQAISQATRSELINSLTKSFVILIVVFGGLNAIETTSELKIKFRRKHTLNSSDFRTKAIYNLIHAPNNEQERALIIDALSISKDPPPA